MALVFLVIGGIALAIKYQESIFIQGAVVATSIADEADVAVAPLPAAVIGTGPIAIAQEYTPADTARTLLPAASVSGGAGSPTPTAAKAVAASKKKGVVTADAKAPSASGGYFKMPTTGKNWGTLHAHGGVDIANSCGTAVYAAAAGTVTSRGRGWNGGYGVDIILQHDNGTETRYAHLQSVNVETGEKLEAGDLIGGMGRTGKATGCHLHFEVHGAKNPFVK